MTILNNRRFDFPMIALIMLCTPTTAWAKTDVDTSADASDDIVVNGKRGTTPVADRADVGIFHGQTLLDTPLTVTVLDRALIEAQDARSVDDVLRNVAGVTLEGLSPTVSASFSSRGVRILPRANFRLNGTLPIINYLPFPLENKERVEVLKGVSALYYGFAAPSAVVNLVTRRAGTAPVTTLRVDGDVEGSYGAGFDLARRQGRFGARLNAYVGHLETPIDGLGGHRMMMSGAFDYDPTDRLSLRFDVEHYERTIGEPGSILIPAAVGAVGGVGGTVTLPAIPNPHNNYGPRGTDYRGRATNILGHVAYRLGTGDWELRADGGIAWTDRNRWIFGVGAINATTGAGMLSGNYMGDEGYRNNTLRVEVGGTVTTGPIRHELTFGYANNRLTDVAHATQAFTAAQNVITPLTLDAATFKLGKARLFPVQYTRDVGFYALDMSHWGEAVTVIGGVRGQRYRFEKPGSATQAIDTLTPTAGLILRPTAHSSVYASYVEGLESAGTAPDGTTNAGQTLPALVSRQWEVGTKYQTGGVLATLAWFNIDRARAYANAAKLYVVDGRAVHRGAEASVQGAIGGGVSVALTGQYLEALQQKTSSAEQNGKPIINAPTWAGSAFAQYRPQGFDALGFNAGVYYTGKRSADVQGRASIAGFATISAGADYRFDLGGNRSVTARVTADNLFDKRYWATAGDANLYTGLPRTIRFALTAGL